MTRIGTSDLDVFPLALGANTFGWTSDEPDSHRIIEAFLGAGGSLIDTADSYSAFAPGNSGGESETVIGNWFTSTGRRDDVVLATKVSQHPQFKGLAAARSLLRPTRRCSACRPIASTSTTHTSMTRTPRSRRRWPPSTHS